MNIRLTDQQRAQLEVALTRERDVRQWRRYQAIRLLAQGQSPQTVTAALNCSVASVYKWADAWRERGLDGMRESPRPGRAHSLDARAERQLETWLADDPRTHGYQAAEWTAPLLLERLNRAGYAVSEHTLRRALHRLGWRWKHLKYVPGRPASVREPAVGEVVARVGAVGQGGTRLFGPR
jgi:transposase